MNKEQRFRRFLAILAGTIVIATLFVLTKAIFFHQAISLSNTLRFVIAGVVIATILFEYKRMQVQELRDAEVPPHEDTGADAAS